MARVTIVFLLCLVALGAVGCGSASPAVPFDLYVADTTDGHALVPLDPDTLADRGDEPSIELGSPVWNWSFSADGSTAIGALYPRERGIFTKPTIVVRDARTGTERARFAAPESASSNASASPSRDGRRVLVQWRAATDRWFLVDAADGRVIGQGHTDEPAAQTWPDPDLQRLYRIVTPVYGPDGKGPGPAQLVAYDLRRGAQVGRLELPGVTSGWWPGDRVVRGERVARYLSPGAAPSPDGRRIAMVDADSDRVTLIDAETLAVERSFLPSRPGGPWDWLPFVVRSAFAKFAEGEAHAAAFGPDGRRLYVWGSDTSVDTSGEMSMRGRGLTALDLDRGTLVASVPLEEEVYQVLPTPDGRAVYVLTMAEPSGERTSTEIPYRLRRLNADTLAVEAERPLAGYRRLVLLP